MPRKLSTREILELNLGRSRPHKQKIMLWAHNIRSLHNIGALFRSSDAFGVDEVILSGYSPTPDRPEVNKTAIGAEEFVKWTYYDDWNKVIASLKKENVSLVALEQTDESIALPELNISDTESICILLGNEVSGIEEELLPYVDQCVEIPQFGHKHSLNVSVAAGIVLYDIIIKNWS